MSDQEKLIAAPLCLGPDPNPHRPAYRLPPGATDCHCHVFDRAAKYPMTAHRGYTPPPAPVSDYLRMCTAVGLERTVLVSASVYGFDNALTLDSIAAIGQHRARGVAGVPADIDDHDLEKLHVGGIRGARLSSSRKSYGGTDLIETLAQKIKPFGWHLQLHLGHIDEMVELETRLLKTAVPLVFDHMGGVRGSEGVAAPGFQALIRVLKARDDCWVKLSSWYRRSDALAPAYVDMRPLAQTLVAARPDRVTFGTNWPHTSLYRQEAMPNDGALIDQLGEWIADPSSRGRILATNPAQLYGFGQ